MQFWKISTNAAPLWAWAALSTSGRFLWTSIARATKRPPDHNAKAHGRTGRSTEPNGVDGLRVPTREVGEYWPLVRPYISLLNRRIWQSRVRRRIGIVWLPPIDKASPSPVMIQTSNSGLASLTPVATAGARPWMVWKP